MTTMKAAPTKTGTVEMVEKDLSDIDLDEVRAGLKAEKAMIESWNFKGHGPKQPSQKIDAVEDNQSDIQVPF